MKEFVLTRGKVAIVDDEDFERLIGENKWFCWKSSSIKHPLFYAVRHRNDKIRSLERMHIVIMDPPKGFEIDHIDGNGLNNRKSNLRIVNRRQNCQNRYIKANRKSKYPGVFTEERLSGLRKPWRSKIQTGDKVKYLGYFSTEEEAAEAYSKEVENANMSCNEGY